MANKAMLGVGAIGVVAGLILLARRAGAEEPPPPPPGLAQLYGRVVTDTGEPILGALVTLDGQTSPTTIEGDYLFVNLEPGVYNATFSKDNYETGVATITLTEGNNEFNVALTPSTFTGFILALQNLPSEAVQWNANFAENTFNYDPIADSGWLSVNAQWDYPSDPRGVTTLRIWALDANNNILFDVRNLGPVNNGITYIYDHATGVLHSEG